jgi:hypothetical protein
MTKIAGEFRSDAEIITTAVCAAMFFGGNHTKACNYQAFIE